VATWCATLGAVDARGRAGDSGSIGWIGLYSTELVEWLENENRLGTLCSPHAPDTEAWKACRHRNLQPKVLVVRLRTQPNKDASAAGDLMLEAVPGQGLRAFYVPPEAGAAVSLTPDVLDSDWGYGPFFDHSIVERRGTWVRLPEVPLPRDTWLDVGDLGTDTTVTWLEPGDIVESPRGDLFVLEVVNDRVRARHEQERDMWCHGEPQPPVAPFREIWLDRSDVYTSTGHIRLRPKYTRGC
jgi:hypothetical protein